MAGVVLVSYVPVKQKIRPVGELAVLFVFLGGRLVLAGGWGAGFVGLGRLGVWTNPYVQGEHLHRQAIAL